jgi:hypothetical protein
VIDYQLFSRILDNVYTLYVFSKTTTPTKNKSDIRNVMYIIIATPTDAYVSITDQRKKNEKQTLLLLKVIEEKPRKISA